jgi:hypothetical protein
LGLEAQRAAVAAFAAAEGFAIVGEFTEVESGKGSDAPVVGDKRVHDRYAALAQQERLMISQRVTAGLQAAKKRGVKLGNQAIADANREAAAERDAAMAPAMRELAHLSTRKAAAEIERRGLGKLSHKAVARGRVRLGISGSAS